MHCGANFQWWCLFGLSWATSTWELCSSIRLVQLNYSSIDKNASISHFFTASSLKSFPPLKHGSVQTGRVQTSLIFTVFSLNIQNLTLHFPLTASLEDRKGFYYFIPSVCAISWRHFFFSPYSVYISVYLSLSNCPQQPGICQTYECHFPLSLLSHLPLCLCGCVCVCVCLKERERAIMSKSWLWFISYVFVQSQHA